MSRETGAGQTRRLCRGFVEHGADSRSSVFGSWYDQSDGKLQGRLSDGRFAGPWWTSPQEDSFDSLSHNLEYSQLPF